MKSKLVRCGNNGYYVEIKTVNSVAVFHDNASTEGWGARLGRAGSYEEALLMIRTDAGSKRLVIRDCP